MTIWTKLREMGSFKSSLFLLFVGSFLATDVSFAGRYAERADAGGKVIAPFGFPSSQPPPRGSVINLADYQVGLEAQQVCGYSDWSTIQLRQPKKLLSKEYWHHIGKGLQDEATRLAMSLTGALPSMLACNVSPTFCHVFNQAELMSAFEGQLTFNTCQMLDGVANTSMTQAESLRNCINHQMQGRSLTASEARERCLTNPGDADLHKGEKIARTAEQSDPQSSFSMANFVKAIFPEAVQQPGGSSYSMAAGSYRYSRQHQSKSLMTELFPGVEVKQKSSVMRGGTFNPSVERVMVNRTQTAKEKILVVLKAMKELQDQGLAPGQIIERTRSKWEDRSSWDSRGEPSPLYRSRSDGGEPTILVTPEQMLLLLSLSKPGERDADKAIDTPEMKQVVERLAESVGHVQVNDVLAEIYTRTLDQCRRDPGYQGAVAQENCKTILERTKGEIEILAYKRDAERQARMVQVEIGSIVRDVQNHRLSTMSVRGRNEPEAPQGAIPMPGSL
jgi:hypothetical protein